MVIPVAIYLDNSLNTKLTPVIVIVKNYFEIFLNSSYHYIRGSHTDHYFIVADTPLCRFSLFHHNQKVHSKPAATDYLLFLCYNVYQQEILWQAF